MSRGPTVAVHPHGRGDNENVIQMRRWHGGSPPRAWGQCVPREFPARAIRFTPTGVGTINATPHLRNRVTVHPHGRGDNVPLRTVTTHDHGSPPRAWGQFSGVCPGAVQFRFTPTGVGTIDRRRPSGRGTTVHPHGRGDNINRRRPCRATRGSPPRAWGQLLRRSIRHHRRRFTPTGVGTISRCWRKLVNCAVHPHGRGDNTVATASTA